MDTANGVVRKTFRDRIYEVRLSDKGEIVSVYETEVGSKVWSVTNFFQLPLNLQIDFVNELSRRPRDQTLFPKTT